MRLLDENAKMHYYHCNACDKHMESLTKKRKCTCGADIEEIKKWENLKTGEKIEIIAGKILKRLKRK